MVADSWRFSMLWRKRVSETDKVVIGILAFEVAGLMSKLVNLWHSLSDKEVIRLREEIVNSVGLRKLVSGAAAAAADDDYLMDVALNEIMENFGIIARFVARLGKSCVDPMYQRFECFINDPIQTGSEWFGWEYRLKKMDKKVKKMERFVANTMQLSQEVEVLVELEQTLRRMQANPELDRAKLYEFQHKVMWQRQGVKNLREMSPWNRTYDYIVRLLARSLFTILERMKNVFGISQTASVEGNNDTLPRSHSFSAAMQSSVYPSENNLCFYSSGPLGRTCSKSGLTAEKTRSSNKQLQAHHHQSSTLPGKHPHSKSKRLGHAGPFKGCMMSGSDSPILQSCKPIGGGSMRFSSVHMKNIDKMEETNIRSLSCGDRIYYKLSLIKSKRGLLTAPPSTLGDAGLALHYANLIILIEKLASSPHLIGLDERDDLYNMLTASIRTALRARLKSYGRTLASSVYNASLAEEWSLALVQIFEWLAPLAHNMIRWHSERNFEKENVVSGTNVLLVQTLHFANQAKTEAAITELLVGLNYMCKISRELNQQGLPETARSRGYDEHLLKRVDIAYNVL